MKKKRGSIASSRYRTRANQKGKGVKGEDDDELCHFANLPAPIITNHIMLPLPIKSLAICRLVCKTWNALISDPHFTSLRLHHAPSSVMIRTNDLNLVSRTVHLLELQRFERNHKNKVKLEPAFKLPLALPDDLLTFETSNPRLCFPCYKSEYGRFGKFGVVNSCNGLLCLESPFKRDLVVCNPVTGEFITLPKSLKIAEIFECVSVGFGFHSKNNEYKVVKVWMTFDSCEGSFVGNPLVQIYTLGKPTWRNVHIDTQFLTKIKRLAFPTCVNDALHWIHFDGYQSSILCFDFESERFVSFPSLAHVLKDNTMLDTTCISMAELGGFLYLCDASSCNSCIMWVMKDYDVGGSWTPVFKIDNLHKPQCPYGLCWPVKHVENGAAILMQHSSNCFVYYEPEKDGYKLLRVIGTRAKLFEVIPHTPTLVSLKDVVNGDNIEVLNVYSRCAKFKLEGENEDLFLTRR